MLTTKNIRRSMAQNNIGSFTKYILEKTRERFGLECNKELIEELEKELKEKGTLETAQEKIKRDIEEEKKLSFLRSYAQKLLSILKDFTIWKIGKFDNELKEIKDVLKEDKGYTVRMSMFEELMKLPKYEKLDTSEKIIIAMKLGALDFSDVMKSES